MNEIRVICNRCEKQETIRLPLGYKKELVFSLARSLDGPHDVHCELCFVGIVRAYVELGGR